MKLDELRSCADEVHAVKDKYGLAVFVLSFVDWILRKLLAVLGFMPKHGYWQDARWRHK